MRRNNLNIVLPERNRVPCELASSVVPARGCSSARAELGDPPSACRCIDWLVPTEFGAICPHPVQDDGKASGQGNDRLFASAMTSDLHAPSLEPGPFLGACEEHLRRLVECGPHHGVPTL